MINKYCTYYNYKNNSIFLNISLSSKIRITVHGANIQFPCNICIAMILGCDNIKYSTKFISRQSLFLEEKIEFDIKSGEEEIYIVILDQELKDKQEIGGYATLNLQDFYDHQPYEKTFELKDKYKDQSIMNIFLSNYLYLIDKILFRSYQRIITKIKNLENDLNEYQNYIRLLFLPLKNQEQKSQNYLLIETTQPIKNS